MKRQNVETSKRPNDNGQIDKQHDGHAPRLIDFDVSTFRRLNVSPRGFTLLETALAIIIVGVGVLAIVSAQTAFHKQNGWSTHASVATHLANEIREMTLNLSRHDPVTGSTFWGPEPTETSLADYDDLDDFDGGGDGTIFSAALENGPINAQRQIIPNMPGWTQIVSVVNVQTNDINNVLADATTTMMRMQVIVTYQGPQDQQPMEMTRVSWISPK
jgi:prepilin-type N-terminal cleavage/methylation domain-containing protein